MNFSYYLKDGLPSTLFEKIIARNFLISDIIVLIVSIILMIVLTKRKKWRWHAFWYICIPSAASGLLLGAIIYKIDPEFPGWVVPPWSSSGWIGFWCVEDILFYIFLTIFFYGVYRLTEGDTETTDFKWAQGLKITFFIFMWTASLLMLSFGGICGKLETLMYAVPSMVLMIYAWHKINCRHMLLFIGTMVFFEILWDCFAVSWIYHYKSWAPGWIYITWDQNGIAHFSSVFLDPAKHRWAWIFNNPVDITPWYGITGSSFIYMAINSVDIFLVRRKYAV
ncbi:MAG: hypothetical protein GX089_09315 [Fibrobacter sp.]|jgi:hypothetical protein|nr:hypothetical protein [Fibrobacter sp.]